MARRSAVAELPPAPVQTPQLSALVASAAAMTVDQAVWRSYRFSAEQWQNELWRLYDVVPEFRFLADWVGKSCGRVRIYAAEVDANGRVQQETADPTVAAIVDQMLGGPAAKAECLRLMGLNLTVAGEVYVAARSTPQDDTDQWLVISSTEFRRYGGTITYNWYGERVPLVNGSDLLIRVWTPHPRRMMWPDSPARANLSVLMELEKLQAYIFSQLNSRLASAGVWFIPAGIDFPPTEGPDGQELTGTDSFVYRMVQTASIGIKGQGEAANVVPMVVEVPDELAPLIKPPVTFESMLSEQALDLRKEALERLAWGMDTPPEILAGTAATNHWETFHVDESTVKSVIEPLMNRIVDALGRMFFQAALKVAGKDPKKYVLWFDTAGLTVRPQRLQDTLNLFKEKLVSAAAVLRAGSYALSDAPSEDEKAYWNLWDLSQRDPTIFANPLVRKLMGITEEMLPADTEVGMAATPPPPPPVPPTTVAPRAELPLIPATSQAPGAPVPSKAGVPGAGLKASGEDEARQAVAMVVIGDATVRRALEVAGNRLLDRSTRGKFPEVAPHELHTRIKVTSQDKASILLHKAWVHLPDLADAFDIAPTKVELMEHRLNQYATGLLLRSEAHRSENMMSVLGDLMEEVPV